MPLQGLWPGLAVAWPLLWRLRAKKRSTALGRLFHEVFGSWRGPRSLGLLRWHRPESAARQRRQAAKQVLETTATFRRTDVLRSLIQKPDVAAPAGSGRSVGQCQVRCKQAPGRVDHNVWFRDHGRHKFLKGQNPKPLNPKKPARPKP